MTLLRILRSLPKAPKLMIHHQEMRRRSYLQPGSQPIRLHPRYTMIRDRMSPKMRSGNSHTLHPEVSIGYRPKDPKENTNQIPRHQPRRQPKLSVLEENSPHMKRLKSIKRERLVHARIVVKRNGRYVYPYRRLFISVIRLIVAPVHACVLWEWLFPGISVFLGYILYRVYP